MAKKILIIGDLGLSCAGRHVATIAEQTEIVLVENNVEAKNIINVAFEPEPMILTDNKLCPNEIILKDFPRNKYFDRPKNNFRK